jgi:hypothetical protein
VWLKNVEIDTECYACPKCQISIFHNNAGYNAHIQDCNGKSNERKCIVNDDDEAIDPNFTNNQVMKRLAIKDQTDKFKKTKYYITFDIETMEELINPNLNKKIKKKVRKKIRITVNKLEDGT